MDWDDLRFFLEVVRSKSLTAAARHLRVTQSTVGRRLASLEARLGVRLVRKTREGYAPTIAGEAIQAHIERVEGETRAIERVVGGLDLRLEGTVRVAGPVLLASYLLAPCSAALHARYPDIALEMLCYIPEPNFALREAEIAVSLRRFEERDLVVRRIGTLAFGLYASRSYLDRLGEPCIAEGCAGHRLISLTEEHQIPGQAEWLAENAGCAETILRTDCREAQVCAALHGEGLALLPCFRAEREPSLRRVGAPGPTPGAEIWLAVHQDNRRVPRIRAVLDCIADTLRRRSSVLNPDPERPSGAAVSGLRPDQARMQG